MLKIFEQKKALSVGVSNWNIADLQEIEDAGLPMPSVNQVPFNLYHSSAQQELRDYCAEKGILFHGYSGLGAPDVFTFPFNNTGMVSCASLTSQTCKRFSLAQCDRPSPTGSSLSTLYIPLCVLCYRATSSWWTRP